MRKNILKKVKIWRVPDITAAVTGFLCSAISVPAMADSGAIINGISNGTQQIWNILVGIVAPIAAVALAICAIKIIWGGQRAAEEAKRRMIKAYFNVALRPLFLSSPNIAS